MQIYNPHLLRSLHYQQHEQVHLDPNTHHRFHRPWAFLQHLRIIYFRLHIRHFISFFSPLHCRLLNLRHPTRHVQYCPPRHHPQMSLVSVRLLVLVYSPFSSQYCNHPRYQISRQLLYRLP